MQVVEQLKIVAGLKDQKTYLKDSFCGQPFKIADITEDRSDSMLRLILRSSSPGILDQDHYKGYIRVEEGAALHLTTQAYQRLYTMKGDASMEIQVALEKGASLVYLPHPVVPHRNANFRVRNQIHLKDHTRLIWSDIVTSGRKLSGESFAFTRYQNTTDIFLNGKLVVRENIWLTPEKYPLHQMGQMEEYTHQSTLIFMGPNAHLQKWKEKCLEYLTPEKEMLFGVTALPIPGLLVRMLGTGAEKMWNYHLQISQLLQDQTR